MTTYWSPPWRTSAPGRGTARAPSGALYQSCSPPSRPVSAESVGGNGAPFSSVGFVDVDDSVWWVDDRADIGVRPALPQPRIVRWSGVVCVAKRAVVDAYRRPGMSRLSGTSRYRRRGVDRGGGRAVRPRPRSSAPSSSGLRAVGSGRLRLRERDDFLDAGPVVLCSTLMSASRPMRSVRASRTPFTIASGPSSAVHHFQSLEDWLVARLETPSTMVPSSRAQLQASSLRFSPGLSGSSISNWCNLTSVARWVPSATSGMSPPSSDLEIVVLDFGCGVPVARHDLVLRSRVSVAVEWRGR